MLEVRCHTYTDNPIDLFGSHSATIDGSAWFEQASAEDIHDFLDGGWQGNTFSSFAAVDFLDFYRNAGLEDVNHHLEANSDLEIGLLLDIDPEQALAWFETNRPEIADELSQTQRASFAFA